MKNNRKYKIKDTLVKLHYDSHLQIGDEPGFSCEIEDETGFFKQFTNLLDGSNTITDISNQMSYNYPEITEEYITEVIEELNEFRLVKEMKEEVNPRHISNLNFFESFSDLNNNETKLLNKMRDIKVGIVGLGGLGSNILTQLSALGCQDIYVIEPDSVEEKNLNRQFLYRVEDIDERKAVAAKKHIGSLNPETNVHSFVAKVNSTDDLENILPSDLDLLICAADSPLLKIQLWCNQYCVNNNIPLFTGGLGATQGHFLTVNPKETPCLDCFYRNFLTEKKQRNTVSQIMKFNNKNAAMGFTISIIASSIVSEIVKLFSLNMKPTSLGRRVFVDFLSLQYNLEQEWEVTPNCICSSDEFKDNNTILDRLEGEMDEYEYQY